MKINSLKKTTNTLFFSFFFEPPRSNLVYFTTLNRPGVNYIQSFNYNYTFNNYTPSVKVDSLTIAIMP